MVTVWRSLKACPEELRLDTTLKCGQSFRWKVSGENEWSCAFKGRLISLRQTESNVEYRSYQSSSSYSSPSFPYNSSASLSSTEYYAKWCKADKNFAKVADRFQGVRILRQDPVENLICFICSTNNNIARISKMIEKLCNRYGNKVYTLNGEDYYDFPTLDKLASDNIEMELRELGFGYRAKYIVQTVNHLVEKCSGGEEWLYSLRNLDYRNAHNALLQLSGVGPKVADCVCLMSLDKHNSIPVDTHVWQIAKRDYGFASKTSKNLTNRLYELVGDHFRNLFGDYSGWAHSVLFAADLKMFEKKQQYDNNNTSSNNLKTKKNIANNNESSYNSVVTLTLSSTNVEEKLNNNESPSISRKKLRSSACLPIIPNLS
ncbi:18087_t:CDS:2 [Entrophospora sp. SA101]|nr:18087_t:CDS:2 [Entrophospora sp. SA101]